MSTSRSTSKASQETIQTIHNVSKSLNLKFTAEQIEALIGVFELGADPDCVMRYISENSNSLQSQRSSLESNQFTPSTSVPRTSNLTRHEPARSFMDRKNDRFDPN